MNPVNGLVMIFRFCCVVKLEQMFHLKVES